ncbi:hypothetical protein E1B28_004944 [Marasmius oreades]|uniref:Uncharacterized protein n=1 Tax=Marasmius oreades TaxID=181124 RepID=A0A9P7UZU9_9AGAR|nr:uncharacterized protein E1B28_004944 [Marasmius oreades]KAG7097610.1 hypothetical protein E1B28_004944 [Marasmius oreades]
MFKPTIFVVAAIVLSLVQARPMLVLDAAHSEPVNSQNGTHVFSLQSASMKDACSDGTIACIDQLLAQCMNGRWSLARKRSRAANIPCGNPQTRKEYSAKYSDKQNKASDECECESKHSESKVAATPTGSTTMTTTTLTPEQAKVEISRLLRSAMSTAYYTSTGTSYTAGQTAVASSSTTSDCTSTTSSSENGTTDCSMSTSAPYPASQTTRTSPEDASSECSSRRTVSLEDYPSSSPSATSMASTTGTESGSGAIINIRLTTVPLSMITATVTSTSATTSATKSSVNNKAGGGEGGADAIVSIRLTTIPITPTAT